MKLTRRRAHVAPSQLRTVGRLAAAEFSARVRHRTSTGAATVRLDGGGLHPNSVKWPQKNLGFDTTSDFRQLIVEALHSHEQTASPQVLNRLAEEASTLAPALTHQAVAHALSLALTKQMVRHEGLFYAGREPTPDEWHTLELGDIGLTLVPPAQGAWKPAALNPVQAGQVTQVLYQLEDRMQRARLVGFEPRNGGVGYAIDGTRPELAGEIVQRFSELWAGHARQPTKPNLVTLTAAGFHETEAVKKALDQSTGGVLHVTGIEPGDGVLEAMLPHLLEGKGERLLLVSGQPKHLREALAEVPTTREYVESPLLELS